MPPAEPDDRSSAEIRRDIVERRRAADRTVNELEERLAPGHLVEEVWDAVKRQASGGGEAVGDVVRQHPVPVALVGIGLGWLVIESLSGRSLAIDPGDDDRWPTYDTYGRYDDGATSELAAAGEDDDRSLTGKTKDTLSGGAAEARHRAARYSRRGRRRFWEAMDRQPLAVGTVALGLGVLAGLALPTSEWEDETMGDARDRLAREARRTAAEAVEKGKQVADAAVAGAAREADRQAPRAEDLRRKAKAVADEARRAGKERAEEIGATPEDARRRAQETRRRVAEEAKSS